MPQFVQTPRASIIVGDKVAGSQHTTLRQQFGVILRGHMTLSHSDHHDLASDVSSEALAQMLDLADEVLREHHLLFSERKPQRTVIEHPELTNIHYQFNVLATPSEIADMNLELATKFANKIDHISSDYHVSFTGSRA